MPRSEPILKKEIPEGKIEIGEQTKAPEEPVKIEGLPNMLISDVSDKLARTDQRTADQILELIEKGDYPKADLLAEQHIQKPIPSKVKSEVSVNIHNLVE